jgi:hypothetical protein
VYAAPVYAATVYTATVYAATVYTALLNAMPHKQLLTFTYVLK